MSYWKNWHPVVIDPTTSTIADIKKEMTGDEGVDFLVYLFENPKSPFKLPGSTSLFTHDCIHIMLRRGLLDQDEAFVIGFSMGTDETTKDWHVWLFKNISKRFYPKVYKFKDSDFKAFDLGFEYARKLMSRGYKNLHLFPFKEIQNKTIKDVSAQIGINLDELNEYREKEKKIIPNTYCSNRLYKVLEQNLDEDMLERETLNTDKLQKSVFFQLK